MTKVGSVKFIFLFLFVSVSVFGQKVKYKDIFALLNAKQYEQAEPFLKRYLKENDDNPNAFLFMGIIYQDKSGKMDVLKQTKGAIANMDSAILFYDRALKALTEKEVKKNDEYYQAYNRRDLRTGEFGVKLSDIQFDLQKRNEGLRERIDRVKMVKYYFALSDSLYKKSTKLFTYFQQTYPGENEMYLRADEETVKGLSALAIRFDSCTKAFEHYKASLSNLGKTGYNQSISLTEIKDYKGDGVSGSDFYLEEVSLWDYKKFAEKSKLVIEKEIFPMRDNLVNYDIEINKLRERLTRDSVSVKSDLTRLINKLLYDQLKKFDADPLPMEVFTLKTTDLEYRSTLLENKPYRDSANVHLRLKLVKAEMKVLDKLDSIAGKLTNANLEEEVLNYNHFISNTYSNSIVLKSYIKALKEYAEREKRKKTEELELHLGAINWIIDKQDSISVVLTKSSKNFKPLIAVEEKYTAGLTYKDSLSADGYFYTITASRKPETKVIFPIDKPSFKLARLPVSKSISYTDAGGQLYFILIFSERVADGKYPATLAKIYRSDGLAWSVNYKMSFVPVELTFKQDIGELTIKGESQVMVIDKNGKLLK